MPSLTIHELPEQERPREKLAKSGVAGLSNSELIAILLRTGTSGANALDVARTLLERFCSLNGIARASIKELAAIRGVGQAKAVQLAAAFGLAARLAAETLTHCKIDSSQLVYDLLGAEMRILQKESLRIILLDTRYHLIRMEEISLGSLSESIAHPREIFRPALIHNAYAIILAHNHPSGDPTPSDADHRMTRRLSEAARLLQITLLDHVIVGAPGLAQSPYFSFKDAGIL